MAGTNDTTQQTPLASTPKSLLSLPAEIRNQIYRHVFADVQVEAVCAIPTSCFMVSGSLRSLDYHPDASINAPDIQKLALAKVSRQLRHEAIPVFLETASFDIGHSCYGFHGSFLEKNLIRAATENFENCKRRIRRSYKSVWGITPNTDSSSFESVASAWFNDQKKYPAMEEVTLHIKWFYEEYYENSNCKKYLEGLRTLVATKQPLRVNIEICLLMSREPKPETPNGDPEASARPTFARLTLIDGKLQPYTRVFGGALMQWQTNVLTNLGLNHPPSTLLPRSQRYAITTREIKV